MRALANQIIAHANNTGLGISNLELQKVMYFAIGSYIRDNGIDEYISRIYSEPFEAWPYGPVVRSIYFEHKMEGRKRIIDEVGFQEELANMDLYILEHIARPVSELVEESHQHPLWANNVERIMQHQKVSYTLEDMLDAFVE